MKRNLVLGKKISSSFLNYEKDIETILRKLFIESQPYSDTLKRLLVINTKDCLTNLDSEIYLNKLKEMNLAKLRQEKYVQLMPKIRIPEHEEIKTYLILAMGDYQMNRTNPQFRNNMIYFYIICHTDYWEMDNYQIRPLKIAGYIDGLLNECKLSGIGTLHFAGCDMIVQDENLSGYVLAYEAVHGSDDQIPSDDE